jgi:PiT family inorganic phosphate transporter
MELNSIRALEQASNKGRGELFRLGTAILFIVLIMLIVSARLESVADSYLLVIAAMMGSSPVGG